MGPGHRPRRGLSDDRRTRHSDDHSSPTLHDLNADIGKYNAPRVMWDVEGDFEVEVRVDGDFRPGNLCNRAGGIPFVGAGIVICDGGDNFVRLSGVV